MHSQGRESQGLRGGALNLGLSGADAKPPRVIAAFAVYMGFALILAALLILYFVRHNVESNAKQRAMDQTALGASMIVPRIMPEEAWEKPLSGELLLQAYSEVGANLGPNDGMAVSLYGANGRLLFSSLPTARDAEGKTAEYVERAINGERVSALKEFPGEDGADDVKAIETYAAVMYPGADAPAGVLVGYRNYDAVAGAIRTQALPIAGAVIVVFILLYLALLPLLRRMSRQLSLSNQELRHRAEVLNENLDQRAVIEQRLRETIASLERSENALALSQEETIMRLSMAVETRDQETGDHIERMGRYCELLAEKLGWSADRCELLRIAAPLHDVGKIAVPDAILLKPGKLTPEERVEIERHAEIGHEILAGSDSPLLDLAARIALSHHEHWDGGGYPNQLSGEQIPIEGRMAAIADVFDALTSDRVYRPAMTVERALAIMSEGRGSHFDPELLDVFFDSIVEVMMIRDGNVEKPRPDGGQQLARRRGKRRNHPPATQPDVADEGDTQQRSMVG